MPDSTRFRKFLDALAKLALEDQHDKVTAHTSAVSIRWDDAGKLDQQDKQTANGPEVVEAGK